MELPRGASSFHLSTPIAILISGVVIALAIVYVGTAKTLPAAQDLPTEEPLAEVRAPGAEDHVYGSREAELVLIEYSDFECPFCSRIHDTLRSIVDEGGGEIAWVYRHFPLTAIHQEALPSAIASECVAVLAGEEAFWHFSTLLFANQAKLGEELYSEAAESLGIEKSRFSACFAAGDEAGIRADYEEAIAAGGQGTPFVIIRRKDGEAAAFSGALPREYIEQMIRALADR